MKGNLRTPMPAPETDVIRDAYFVSAIWRLLGAKIVESRISQETKLAILNAVYVSAGQPPERILDALKGESTEQRIPLPQTTFQCDRCAFQPEPTLGAFTSSLR